MKTRFGSVLILGLLGALAGCSSDSHNAGAAQTGDQVEIYSWWTAPGEREALQALFTLYKADHPDSNIYNAALDAHRDAAELKMRLQAHDPPELFQETAQDLHMFLQDTPDSLERLDGMFDELGLRSAVFPEVIEDVTYNGGIYAMPVNLHRQNTLFFNPTIFAQNQISTPTSLDDFVAVCEKLKQAGVTPIATSYQGWIQHIMFDSIAVGLMGTQKYYDYFNNGAALDPVAFKAAIAAYADILDKYTNSDAGDVDFDWTKAADKIRNGEAAMFLHGDWAKGYYVQLSLTPGVDFGAAGAPGSAEMFLYGVDTFALPVGAKNEPGARDFLKVVASPAGQLAFNSIKGSSPMRSDVDTSTLDQLAQDTLQELKDAKLRMLVRTQPAWDDAFGAFALNRDQDALYQVFVDNPP